MNLIPFRSGSTPIDEIVYVYLRVEFNLNSTSPSGPSPWRWELSSGRTRLKAREITRAVPYGYIWIVTIIWLTHRPHHMFKDWCSMINPWTKDTRLIPVFIDLRLVSLRETGGLEPTPSFNQRQKYIKGNLHGALTHSAILAVFISLILF